MNATPYFFNKEAFASNSALRPGMLLAKLGAAVRKAMSAVSDLLEPNEVSLRAMNATCHIALTRI